MDLFNNETFYFLFITVVTVWSTILKGVALWRAVNLSQRNWFIALLIVNTIGILELIYLFRFAKKRLTITEVKSWINNLRKN